MGLIALGLVLLAAAPSTLAQNAQYCATAAAAVTCTYPANTDATFTVPAGVTDGFTITLTGGRGGDASDGSQGAVGATVTLSNVELTAGTGLTMRVRGSERR